MHYYRDVRIWSPLLITTAAADDAAVTRKSLLVDSMHDYHDTLDTININNVFDLTFTESCTSIYCVYVKQNPSKVIKRVIRALSRTRR